MKIETFPGTYYVSIHGNDSWSGSIPAPNRAKTDGPFRTLYRAQEAVRSLGPSVKRRVIVREGVYHLDSPLLFTAEDSGSAQHPVVYEACTDERVLLSGGVKIDGWRRKGKGFWKAAIPADISASCDFRQLRIGDEAQRLARYPDYKPENPLKGGWLFARPPEGVSTQWVTSVANIHTPGDWIEWDVTAPQDGTYHVWVFYGQLMKPHGRTDMDGRTGLQVDDGDNIPLLNLPDTGGWGTFSWSRSADIALKKGKHVLRWTNREGGGINLNAFALTPDSQWKPDSPVAPIASPDGPFPIIVQAQEYRAAEGKELKIASAQVKGRNDEINFTREDIPETFSGSHGQVMIFPAWGWVGGIVQFDRIDHETGIIHLTGDNAKQEVRIGNRYYIENVRDALTSPGEFYYDPDKGELLLMIASRRFPSEPIITPKLDRIVEFQGDEESDSWPEHIVLRGFQFQDTSYSTAVDSLYTPDDAAIHISHARHITVTGCSFTNLGGYAVRLSDKANACRITRCQMTHMGQGGVISRGDNTTQARDCEIAGCLMHDLGLIYKHVAGIYLTTGSGFRIAHNTIHDVPRYGISFKSYSKDRSSHNNIAEYNDLVRTNLETNDTGAIETLGRDRELSGNIIRFNRILDVIGMKHTPTGELLSPHYTWGIYLDDYSSGTTVFGNITARTVRGAYHNHLGFDNIVQNNIFVDGRDYQAEWNGRSDMERNTFVNNIVVYSNPDAVYIRSGGWHKGVLKECNRNVVWCTEIPLADADLEITPEGTWSAWQSAGYDVDSVIADPGFLDGANDDYRLTDDSPAWQLGFQRIPVEKIGYTAYDGE